MTRAAHFFFAVALCAPLGCTSAAQRAASAKNEQWIRTQRIAVQEFETENIVAFGATGSMKGLGVLVGRGIAKALRENGLNATAIKDDATPQADVVVEGEVGRVFMGDDHNRLTGISSGSATCAVSGKVTSAGRVLGEFHAEQEGGSGVFSSDYTKAFDECVEFLSYDVADQIISGQYNGLEE